MSLLTIRNSIASEAGYHPETNDDDKIYLNKRINSICKDFYDKHDLVGSMFELITFWDQDEKLVSFPYYVGEIRGAHYYDSPMELTLRDIRPRYATGYYGIQLRDFRKIGVSPFAIQMDNYSQLTFSLPEGEVEAQDIDIVVIGETPVAGSVQETVTIIAGSNSATSINSWVGAPKIIKKLATNTFNITVTDAEETELSIIPNHLLETSYAIWQVRDDNMVGQLSSNSIEILYKAKLPPLVNDGDEFLTGDYDDAILWKFLDEFWSKQEGKESLVENARVLWSDKIAGVNKTQDSGKKVEFQTVPNKFYGLFDRGLWRRAKYP